ncbi:uncharacterized protein LOC110933190 [Helianthus annuus]|uniref:uncharacterized protein LOC110933190 n=1 Tax=Helianthus annuus TaxID=4232 RepID=UPI000B8F03B8|nr:uncharacterized protein LOC110933190 [Helianthus annuus]
MFFCSIVYAANYYVSRRELWQHLSMHKVLVGSNPWVIMGDFNSALNLEDNSFGTSAISISMREFQACIDDIEVFDINRTGFHFTWNQKPKEGIGLLRKIDRVLGNTAFVEEYLSSVAVFNSYRLSDHCPCILKIPKVGVIKRRSFKFANFLVFKPEFLKIVQNIWESNVDGVHQFRVVKKLSMLKSPLRALLYQQGNLHKKVADLRAKLDLIQRDIDEDPLNLALRNEESKFTNAYQEACLDEERNHRSRIDVIKDVNGIVYEGDTVQLALVQHYEKFLGCHDDVSLTPTPNLFSNKLQPEIETQMIRQVTEEEVKKAMFSIGIDKALGPDG